MNDFKPKLNLFRLKYVANLVAIFALISQILFPQLVLATTSDTMAISSQKLASIIETTISESPDSRLINVEPIPDRVVPGVITAYTSTPDQTDDSPFIAASGKRVYDGMIAVNGLPFGTKIKIPELYGDKIFTVHDRMNKRYFCHSTRCRLDIWLDTSKAEAKKFGVKQMTVEIYLPEKKLAQK